MMRIRKGARSAQDGEDRILDRLLRRIGAVNHVAVEFGAKDGLYKSNTVRLREKGWRVVLFDSVPEAPFVIEALITRENVNQLFTEHGIPHAFDVLSIDVDGNDLWIWEALTFAPRIVVIEYNASLPAHLSLTVPYDDARIWDHTNYYGASVLALNRLAKRKGYRLYAFTKSNLIFVQRGLVSHRLHLSRVPVPRPTKRPDPLSRPWVTYP